MKKNGVFKVAQIVCIALQILLAAGLVVSIVNMATANLIYGNGTVLRGILSLISIVGIILVLFPVQSLLKEMHRKASPFVAGNSKKLKAVALILFGISAVNILAQTLPQWVTSATATASGQSGYVATHCFSFDLSTFLLPILAFVILCIALVFEYGTVLQTESDETL